MRSEILLCSWQGPRFRRPQCRRSQETPLFPAGPLRPACPESRPGFHKLQVRLRERSHKEKPHVWRVDETGLLFTLPHDDSKAYRGRPLTFDGVKGGMEV